MENGVQIWDPARGMLYDTETNLNEIDLKEPFEVSHRAIFPQLSQSPTDSVHHFRKVLIWSQFVDLLDFFTVERGGKVQLAKRASPQERYRDFSQKMKHLLKTYASKGNVTNHMERIATKHPYLTQAEFYHKVYKRVLKDIKKDL